MRLAKQGKTKKHIAILLVLAMLLTIMPMSVFAEGGNEAAGVTIKSTMTEVTTGQAFTVTASVTTGSVITTPSMIWYVSTKDGTVTEEPQALEGQNAEYSVDRSFSYDTVGEYTIGAKFFDGEISLGYDEVTVTVNAPVEGVIKPDMTQAEIDKIVAESDVITVEEGNYGKRQYL